MDEKRKISLDRAEELKKRIDDYLQVKDKILKGLELSSTIKSRKNIIMDYFIADEKNWNDWQWQLANRINDIEVLQHFFSFTEKEIDDIKKVSIKFRWAISPYYLSLINPNDKYDPIKLMSVPTSLELLESSASLDPMAEEYTNPSGAITRRYPDRLIINVTNECAMYCRHCQRRRNIGDKDLVKSKKVLLESFNYIRNNKEIRDVLITGGDPLTMTDNLLEWILQEIRNIPHVEIIRIGTRVPVTMPQRITDKLVKMLSKYHPLYINTQFNHPMEITYDSKIACEKLANAGIPLGNQAVLLNGINNDKFVMKCLNQELLKIRVKPYYIFHAKKVKGTTHFNTSVADGLEIMEHLRGFTSGLAIPTYIINAPKGKGKTPMLPNYLLEKGNGFVKIRTWENIVIDYPDDETIDIKTKI
ncbi:MAG: glutamate 2,3-aminomutase [Candidatus Izemoplasmatales bacterium]|nr:glutamate 2,3-aminomutase [Candidatus Izemoplasmatales bacterium]